MATGTLKFITWNVNGLKEQRDEKLTELCHANVVFLQETHIREEDDHFVKCIEDDWHVYFTKYTSSERGTAILVRKTLDFDYITDEKDNCGGYVVLKCKLQGQLYTLVSVYNHQTDTETLDKLSRYLQSMTKGLLVIGGDFNTVFNPFLDKKCKTNSVTNNRTHCKLLSCVKKFMKSLQLVDIWRRKHPTEQNYSFCTSNNTSRLDYFFIPEECMWRVRTCKISNSKRPDHQPLSLEINNAPLITFQKDLQIQSLFQLLDHKIHFGIKCTDLLLAEESSHALSEVDIVSAVQSLQVSDTPRPDGIPASFYKEKIQDVIPYIKFLYESILHGTFNCSESFNASVKCLHDNSQHFFNVDYLIITTILARRLEDFLESQSKRRIPRESHAVLITPKTLRTQTMLRCLNEELNRQRRSNLTSYQDFLAAKHVRNAQDFYDENEDLPCHSCPLTAVLINLALKCFASTLFKDFEKSVFYIFKQSVIVCIQPEDLDKVDAILTNSADMNEYEITKLCEPLHQNLEDYNGAEDNWPKRDESEESDEESEVSISSLLPATCKIRSGMYAVVTLQDTDEVMVTPSKWLNADKTQCYWPPFRSAEKCVEAVKNRSQPLTSGKPWEMLNIIFHAEYDTYEEAIEKQDIVKAQKDGLYAVITLLESNELIVIPANWLNEHKTQCYWPPFKSPEMCLEAIKNAPEPARDAWQMLNIHFHEVHATFEQAKGRKAALTNQMEQPSTSFGSSFGSPLQPTQSTLSGVSSHTTVTSQGIKRKRDESADMRAQSLLTTDMDIRMKAEKIIERVHVKVQAIKSTNQNTEALKTHILNAISKMGKTDKGRRKATVGIFGRSGEGKSSLLNAVLGEKSLLPSGGFGACTAVVTHVEANLIDSNYTAEIEFISEKEWEDDIASSDISEEMTETIKERIIALYGADAGDKTLEELKKNVRYIEINNVLSIKKLMISKQIVSEFTGEVIKFMRNCVERPGGWYWPLVKSVTIKIPNCRDLLEHIVLVDLPGTGDCNKIRDDLWKSKLKDCSSLWIVSNINRAVSEKDPWEILEHYIQDLQGGGECKYINFICTKTDEIDTEEHFTNQGVTNEQKHESKEKESIISRNNCAKEELKRKLNLIKSENKDSKKRFVTDVFTVSSKAFLNKSPVLAATETEIPGLQNVLRNLNKNINHKLTRDYLNEAKGVLYLIQHDTKEMMTKARVLEYLQNNLEEALEELDCHFVSLYKKLERCLSIGEAESVELCVKTTEDMISSVRPQTNKGFHKIYRAVCGKGGRHWPKNWNKPVDLNKCLTKHMYYNIDEEFNLIFSFEKSDRKEKSMQDYLDEFSIIRGVSQIPSWQQHIIKTHETKLKASLGIYTVEEKKNIYSSIYKTIQRNMARGYKKAANVKGDGSMQKMENIIKETSEQLKHQMFSEAKVEVLERFKKLKLDIIKTLDSELKSSMEHLLSQTSKPSLLNVSNEIQELERLSQQLSEVKQDSTV